MIPQEVWMDWRALARQGDNFFPIGALVGLDRRTRTLRTTLAARLPEAQAALRP